MFNQNNEEKKLDWMYKGPNSMVDREEYLLGRSVDKTLENLNAEEKQKQLGIVVPPKNRVEHECIPPSIRDFNKVVQTEQVDLSAKLQEDPLVAIKKREEETRREFLQNPIQLKKLQKALKAQAKKKQKKHKHSRNAESSDSDLDGKLPEKLKQLKNNLLSSLSKKSKKSDKDSDLDTILMHKFNQLKSKLSEQDIRDILNGDVSDSSDDEKIARKNKKRYTNSEENSSDDEDNRNKRKYQEKYNKNKQSNYPDRRRDYNKPRNERSDYRNRKNYEHEQLQNKNKFRPFPNSKRDDYNNYRNRTNERESDRIRSNRSRSRSPQYKKKERTENKTRGNDENSSCSSDEKTREVKHSSTQHFSDSDDSDAPSRSKHKNWGLVKSDGSKIPLNKTKLISEIKTDKPKQMIEATKTVNSKNKTKKLTEEEKEKLRNEMMQNAVWRDKEREHNVKKYREKEEKESKVQKEFDPDFIHKQLLKSANSSSVESRIKANLNNIQRSGGDMNVHFSRR